MNARRKNRFFISLVIGIILLASFSAVVRGDDFTSIEGEIERICLDESIPSVQASIVSNGELVWTGQYGNESIESTYMIGSVQKIFTAIAILQLAESGDIASLDDDINNYLSFDVKNPIDKTTPITFNMLLSHRSGMANTLPYQFLWDTEGVGRDYGRLYNAAILEMTAEEYLMNTLGENGSQYRASNWVDVPGNSYLYSPSGYVLLSYMIEAISWANISDYMEENIFAPLQMENTGFALGANQATPHTYFNGIIEPLPAWTGKYMIRSTSQDMARLLIALYNDGQYDGAQILAPESIQLMRQSNPDFSTKANLPFTSAEKFSLYQNGYGLGWIRYCSGIEGHGGSVPGFQTYFLCKEGDTGINGIIVMMNLNAIFSTKGDAEYISSKLNKIRNQLLAENEMLETNPVIIFIATYRIPFMVVGAILTALIINRKTIMKKIGKIKIEEEK